MFKKTVSIFLSISMIVCLSACGNEDKLNEPTGNESSISQTIEETTNNDDLSESTSTTKPDNHQDTSNNQTINSQSTPSHTHSYFNATCTSPKKCSCGATAGTALGHNFSNATCTSPKICSRCGATSGSSLGHSYSNATCTSPKTCRRCGNTNGNALGHNYVNNKCSRCGKVNPESLPVGLENLYVIDSNSNYSFKNETIKDSFGNSYFGYHRFKEVGNTAYAIFNLNYKYAKFSADIITDSNDATFSIYVDNVLKYQTKGFNKLSGPVHFEIDVKNGQQLKVIATENIYSWDVAGCLVNAQLTK